MRSPSEVGRAPTSHAVRAGLVRGARSLAAPIGSVVGVRSSRKTLVLTFDDGPDPSVTPRILGALHERGWTATFFVLLTRTARHPTVLQDVLDAGHEIALHGPDHRRLTGLSSREVYRRTRQARADLEDRIQTQVRWFRPPYGAQHLSTYLSLRRTGLEVVLWGPSLWDWKDATDAQRRDRATRGLAPGAILLGHDGLADSDDGAEEVVSASTFDRATWAGSMFREYSDRGLQGVSLRDALAHGSVVRRAYFTRSDADRGRGR